MVTIQSRFVAFDAAHPDVYYNFKKFAFELWNAGRRRYSADAILHRIRWHYAVSSESQNSFKLNDHFSSRYARKLIHDVPKFAHFFSLRDLRRQ